VRDAGAQRGRFQARVDGEGKRPGVVDLDAGVGDPETIQQRADLGADGIAVVRLDLRAQLQIDPALIPDFERDVKVGADVGAAAPRLSFSRRPRSRIAGARHRRHRSFERIASVI
jgi:hypothetical protein